uniref:Uncharacterized protein n=1 Tax=Steinernema glaseri TaxID=37863 RepID=A0A1I7ZNB6_9BILA
MRRSLLNDQPEPGDVKGTPEERGNVTNAAPLSNWVGNSAGAVGEELVREPGNVARRNAEAEDGISLLLIDTLVAWESGRQLSRVPAGFLGRKCAQMVLNRALN